MLSSVFQARISICTQVQIWLPFRHFNIRDIWLLIKYCYGQNLKSCARRSHRNNQKIAYLPSLIGEHIYDFQSPKSFSPGPWNPSQSGNIVTPDCKLYQPHRLINPNSAASELLRALYAWRGEVWLRSFGILVQIIFKFNKGMRGSRVELTSRGTSAVKRLRFQLRHRY